MFGGISGHLGLSRDFSEFLKMQTKPFANTGGLASPVSSGVDFSYVDEVQ